MQGVFYVYVRIGVIWIGQKKCECGNNLINKYLFKHWEDKGKTSYCQIAVKCSKCGKEEILRTGVKYEVWIEVR